MGNIAYSYADGYKPKDFPMEFGTDGYYKALDTVIEDVIKRSRKGTKSNESVNRNISGYNDGAIRHLNNKTEVL